MNVKLQNSSQLRQRNKYVNTKIQQSSDEADLTCKSHDHGQAAVFSQKQFPGRDSAEICKLPNVFSPGEVRASVLKGATGQWTYQGRVYPTSLQAIPEIPKIWQNVCRSLAISGPKYQEIHLLHIFCIRNVKIRSLIKIFWIFNNEYILNQSVCSY